MLDAALLAARRVRRNDPSTSFEAAAKAGSLAKTQWGLIRNLLATHREPLGAEQIGEKLGIPAYAIRKRLPEMESDGEVRIVGERKASTGRTERTWELV